ncbi:peptidoglycan recognition protein family protein [Streptomyces rimosus]|uniref:peptidoglycan recognition protein family protein n=1 Tax=Streptomyces rimosus TaxID=1927 RepID=UPI00099E8E7A|nr:peptidoglycan recognition family protein [Streptomyces rimosus]
MATPLSAADFLAALRAEGVKVVEVGNWRTHNRNHKGAWGPVHGVIVHHTVTAGTTNSVQICRDGYTSLPGPLCHGVIDKTGVVHLVGYGRANHAGGGDPAVLQQVIDESYGTAPSRPTKGNTNGVDGNHAFYGFECINLGDGKDPWPAAQLDAIERVSAAICRAHSWSAKSVIGHLEWSADKVDPKGFTMPDMRARIAKRLAGKPGTPTTPEENTVALTDADVKKIWSYPLANPADNNTTRQAGTYLRYADQRHNDLADQLDRIEALLKKLTDDKS